MKRIVLSSITAALVLFTGCADNPTPAVDKKPTKKEVKKAVQEIKDVQEETVAPQDTTITPSQTQYVTSESSSIKEEANNNLVEQQDMVEQQTQQQETEATNFIPEFETIHFAFDSFRIEPQAQEELVKEAEKAKESTANYNIKLEGNCDEWGSDEYNFALGLKRANAVKKVLVENGIDADKISMVSYGENNPVCVEKTKECWAKNRRVDFKVSQ
ncbi:Outer membrane lipoprotein omp16 precursor [hydrothermal vent metagenome]|uniref:Outer membrane lipoprotein omp16 n=1 Tax=hydrothermal vent metagenome TaxID=652676 RepID=A0A1W1D2Z3_9ZZZZ